MQHPYGLQCDFGAVGIGRNGHCQGVKDQIFGGNTPVSGFLDNMSGNLDASLCSIGDAVFPDGERNDRAAVSFDKRENGVHTFCFAVYRVDQRLAVIDTHGIRQHIGIRRVELQRQIGHTLQFEHHLVHHFLFINLRQTHIDVQDVCAAFCLPQAFFHQIGQIP